MPSGAPRTGTHCAGWEENLYGLDYSMRLAAIRSMIHFGGSCWRPPPEIGSKCRWFAKKLPVCLSKWLPDALYLPLGVGSHIDHRMVFAAGATLVPNCPLYFYEDQPYAMVRQSVHLRFQKIQAAAMGGNIPLESINLSLEERRLDFLKSFRDAPYVRRYLRSAGERRHCEAELCRKLGLALKPHLHLERKTEMANALDQGRIMNALYAYRSQARSFLGNRKRLLELGQSHARRQGFRGWRAEHAWKPVKAQTNEAV